MKPKIDIKFSTLTLKITFSLWFGNHLIKTVQNKKYQINKVYYYVVVVYHYLIYPFLSWKWPAFFTRITFTPKFFESCLAFSTKKHSIELLAV